jgi:glycosyltransferase involved in cell wall biosynthesis
MNNLASAHASPPARSTLGVVAISKNEERDLPGFLGHLLPWVDEIVIVDDGSTDRTAELARAAGPKVRFIISPRGGNEYFSGQRNKGIAAAASDWLLHMDIDERVTPELAREILQGVADSSKDGYRFRRLNFFLGRPMKSGAFSAWNLVHLARRQLFHFGGKMHESCLLDAPVERVGQLNGLMWHLNDDNYAERLRKSMLYCQIDAETLRERGKKVGVLALFIEPWGMFLRQYLRLGGWRDGIWGLFWSLHCADAHLRTLLVAWSWEQRGSRPRLEDDIRQQWCDSNRNSKS